MWNVWTINDLKCTPFRHLHCLSILYSYTCINNWYLYHPFEYIDQIHVFSESRTRRHNTSQPETDIKKGFQRMKHEIEKIYTECDDCQLIDDGFQRTESIWQTTWVCTIWTQYGKSYDNKKKSMKQKKYKQNVMIVLHKQSKITTICMYRYISLYMLQNHAYPNPIIR